MQNSCVQTFVVVFNGKQWFREDDDKLPDEDADITDVNDGESEIDDGKELSGISNSYEDD